MSREIEFRVWNTYTKKYQTLQETVLKGDIVPYDNELKVTTNYPLILEQHRGLKDKNGNKIFEGDIVNSENYGEMTIKFVDGGYLMSDDRFGIYLHEESFDENNNLIDLEIIGNIHEEEK